MKRNLLLSLFIMAFSLLSFAQAPAQMTYQAVVRAADGKILKDKEIAVKFSILHSTESGALVFAETHKATTNKNGLITVFIGGGSNLQGALAAINWTSGPYFLKMEVDLEGGANYTLSSVSQMLAVPYAFYAEKSNIANTANVASSASSLIGADGFEYVMKNGYLQKDDATKPSDNVIISNNTLVKWPCNEIPQNAKLILHRNITAIGDGAFEGCTELKDIVIPATVTQIGKNAFRNCTNLKYMTLDAKIEIIEEGVFSGCSSLYGLTIPATVKTIKKDAFLNCTSLTSVTIPATVTTVEEGAFKGIGMELKLAAEAVVVSVGKERSVNIQSSLRPEISSANSAVATAVLNGNKIEIKGVAEGTTTIKVNDLALSLEKTIAVTVKIEQISEDGIDWVDISGGAFKMGSDDYEKGREYGEKQHDVTLKSFKISKYAVAFEEYDAFCDVTGRSKPNDNGWGRGKLPVINVSWDDAVAYAEHKGCRLPTEAEWEYACRAGTMTPFSFGEDALSSKTQANYNGEYSYSGRYDYDSVNRQKTINVDELDANQFGLHNMHGNVWEWCNDWYADYSSEAQENPKGPTSGAERVVRGGAWNSKAVNCRSAQRVSWETNKKSNNIGFRLAKDAK